MTTVRPWSCRREIISRNERLLAGSRPAAGSSSTSTCGSMASTPANATRRCWPPESSNGLFSASSSKESPTRSSELRTSASTSSPESPRLRGPKATSLYTVSANSWCSGYWNTTPIDPRTFDSAPFEAMSVPSMSTRPEVGFKMPFMCWMSVDLPLPVCPATPRNSPRRTCSETSRTAHRLSGLLPHFAWRAAGACLRLRCRFASAAS